MSACRVTSFSYVTMDENGIPKKFPQQFQDIKVVKISQFKRFCLDLCSPFAVFTVEMFININRMLYCRESLHVHNLA